MGMTTVGLRGRGLGAHVKSTLVGKQACLWSSVKGKGLRVPCEIRFCWDIGMIRASAMVDADGLKGTATAAVSFFQVGVVPKG